MEIISRLFGSAAKVKIMRLFLFNPGISFSVEDVAGRTKIKGREARKELDNLEKMDLIRKRQYTREEAGFKVVGKGRKKKRKKIVKKVQVDGWHLHENFPYMVALKNLLVNVTLPSHEEIAKRFYTLGRIKMLIVSGLFIQDWESRVDILVVGDSLKPNALEAVIKNLESEIGKELRYSFFETQDFYYRLSVFDKLVRDILDFPHIKIIDKLGVEDTQNS